MFSRVASLLISVVAVVVSGEEVPIWKTCLEVPGSYMYESSSVLQETCSFDGWGVLDYEGSVSNRVLVGWSATVPAGKTVKFITMLKK